jgi:hypothetical protein
MNFRQFHLQIIALINKITFKLSCIYHASFNSISFNDVISQSSICYSHLDKIDAINDINVVYDINIINDIKDIKDIDEWGWFIYID